MNKKDLLLEQFTACYNQASWFVPIMTALDGLTASQASWHDKSTNNSIWQIVNHLTFWNRRYLNRFKGIPNPEMKGDNNSTFENETASGTKEDWEKAVKQIHDVMSEWEEALKQADDSKFDSPMSKDSDDSWAAYVAHINIHNAYHIGQIVTLRKQQSSWDPKRGVN